MRHHTFYSFIALIFTTLLALFGILLYLLARSPNLLEVVTYYLRTHPKELRVISINIMAVSFIFFAAFYLLNRKAFYQVQLDPSLKYSLEPKYVQAYVEAILAEKAPDQKIPFQVICRKKAIEMIADFSQIPFKEHEQLFEQIEPLLQNEVKKQFNHCDDFTLTVLCEKA